LKIELNMCFTIPAYRRRGVGSMVMEWGVKKADELGIEGFLEASELGDHLYTKFGFIEIDRTTIDMTVPNPSEEWKEMERKNLPFGW
jgi:predicted N-acetyltransferase YhbS